MALPNAYAQQQYAQYNTNKIMSASPAELTLMLYEGAIKFCNMAIMGIEHNDIQKANNSIKRVQRIIDEFRATLDMRYPVAEDFDRASTSPQARPFPAIIKNHNQILEEENPHLHSMRDTWKEGMKRTGNGR